jgi:hypothetical protein
MSIFSDKNSSFESIKAQAAVNGNWYDSYVSGQSPEVGKWFKVQNSGSSLQAVTANVDRIHGNLPNEPIQSTFGQAGTIYYESDSATDVEPNIGAWTIGVIEIDDQWNPSYKQITMNGTNAISSANGYGASAMWVESAGVKNTNDGTIFATTGAIGEAGRNMYDGAGVAKNCHFIMPTGWEGFATDFKISHETIGGGEEIKFSILHNGIYVSDPYWLNTSSSAAVPEDGSGFVVYLPPQSISLLGVKIVGAIYVAASYNIYLRYTG